MRDKYEFGEDYTTSSDLFDDVNNLSEWNKKDPIMNAIYEAVEINVRDWIDALMDQLSKIYSHMLKFEFRPDKQTGRLMFKIIVISWEIKDIFAEESIKNTITDDDLKLCYESGVDWASRETGISLRDFPKDIPEDWTIDNISDEEFIRNFMYLRLHTDEARKYYYNMFGEEG